LVDQKKVVVFSVVAACSLAVIIALAVPGIRHTSPNAGPEITVQPAVQIQGEPLQPLPPDPKLDLHKVALGEKLFVEKRLSHDDTISCASCHDLSKGGTDNAGHSIGIQGQIGGINAPSVYNCGLNFVQFWNGRAESLEDQVNGPTHHPKEMGSSWDEIIGKLKKDAGYTADFAAIYQDGILAQNIRDAIATYERSLNTPNSAFDRYLQGDKAALSKEAVTGYSLFKSYGCASCHQGANVGGNMYQHMGVMKDYFLWRGNLTEADYGRYSVTKNEADRFVFRVPSLRNIAKTAPYFHDGSASSLTAAIQIMAKYQLGRPMPEEDLSKIVSFLDSLTGEYHGAHI